MMYASKEGGGGRIPDSYLMQQPLNSHQRHHHAGPHSGTTPLGGMTPSLPEAPWGCASIPRACSFILCIGPLLVLPCVLSRFSRVRLFAILWTVARQAPLSMGFSRQEYWRGCHALLQGIIQTQGSNSALMSPALAGGFFATRAIWGAHRGCFPDHLPNQTPAIKTCFRENPA